MAVLFPVYVIIPRSLRHSKKETGKTPRICQVYGQLRHYETVKNVDSDQSKTIWTTVVSCLERTTIPYSFRYCYGLYLYFTRLSFFFIDSGCNDWTTILFRILLHRDRPFSPRWSTICRLGIVSRRNGRPHSTRDREPS